MSLPLLPLLPGCLQVYHEDASMEPQGADTSTAEACGFEYLTAADSCEQTGPLAEKGLQTDGCTAAVPGDVKTGQGSLAALRPLSGVARRRLRARQFGTTFCLDYPTVSLCKPLLHFCS